MSDAPAPVTLTPYDSDWPAAFRAERDRLRGVLGAESAIAHIGSTSVEGLTAKPIIDILVGRNAGADEAHLTEGLRRLGYVEEGARPDHRWFCWPEPARRRFILHLVPHDGPVWQARLAFRDRLRRSPALQDAYVALKHELAVDHAQDLSAYTAAKYGFVRQVLADALPEVR